VVSTGNSAGLATTPQICAVRRDVLTHVGNRWSALILTLLEKEPRRYSEIRRSCGITQRMLTLNLRELERDGLIVHDGDYALTDAGRSLCSILRSLMTWTDQHYDHIVGSRDRFAVTPPA
jgi:DNA-binding HxlR family transcriptional regulator